MVRKAYEKLETMATFSENFEQFEALFWDALDAERKDEAIALLLRVVFELLKSDGVKYNTLLEAVDSEKRLQLGEWLEQSLRRYGGK